MVFVLAALYFYNRKVQQKKQWTNKDKKKKKKKLAIRQRAQIGLLSAGDVKWRVVGSFMASFTGLV